MFFIGVNELFFSYSKAKKASGKYLFSLFFWYFLRFSILPPRLLFLFRSDCYFPHNFTNLLRFPILPTPIAIFLSLWLLFSSQFY